MGLKRPASHIHPSRKEQVPDEPRRKRQKPDNAGPKSFKKAHPVNDLKSQIRSLKRLLQNNDKLPANVRVEKERALQTTEHDLSKAQKAKNRSDMISRYHKIRFFDKQKATKRLKRARKDLQGYEGEESERARLAQNVEDLEVDVNYAQYYPLEQHYVSLFPRKKTAEDEGGDDGDTDGVDPMADRKGDPEMWQRVKQCMADGSLDALRNSRLRLDNDDAEASPVKTSRSTQKDESKMVDVSKEDSDQRRHYGNVKQKQVDDDNESDGGFFE